MPRTEVEVKVDGERVWSRFSEDGQTGGVTRRDAATLQRVAETLEEALEQARGELRLLQDADGVADVGATSAEVDDPVPVP